MPYEPRLPPDPIHVQRLDRPKRRVLLIYANGLLVRIDAPAELPNVCTLIGPGHEFHLTNLMDRRGELVMPVYMQNVKTIPLPPDLVMES